PLFLTSMFLTPFLYHFSWLDHDLECLALVHRAVSVRYAVEVCDSIEHAARLNPAFEHVRQEFLDIRSYGCWPAAYGDVVEEGRLRGRNRFVLWDSDTAHR